MPTINDLVSVASGFSLGTTYDVANGTLSDPVDNVGVDYADIYHGDAFHIGGQSPTLVSSRYIELTYRDPDGNIIGSNGPAYHITLSDGSSYLMMTDANPYRDLQNIQTIEVSYVDTGFTIEGAASEDFSNDNAIAIACFAAGTMLDVPGGAVAVEDVRVGDMLMTLDDGPRPVRRIYRRALRAADLAARPDWRPVVIEAHALGRGVPERPVTVSPQHRVLVTGTAVVLYFAEHAMLVPAIALVNGGSVRVDDRAKAVTYIHVELDRHHILTSSGLRSESLLRRPQGRVDAQQAELNGLFGLENGVDGSIGKPARPVLRRFEARVLAVGRPS